MTTKADLKDALDQIKQGMADGEIWTTKPINRALRDVLDYFEMDFAKSEHIDGDPRG